MPDDDRRPEKSDELGRPLRVAGSHGTLSVDVLQLGSSTTVELVIETRDRPEAAWTRSGATRVIARTGFHSFTVREVKEEVRFLPIVNGPDGRRHARLGPILWQPAKRVMPVSASDTPPED